MSTYDKETKFYWLQLKEDFFDDDAIRWLEDQKPNGRDYAYFYLKLCLKALKSNGILIRKVGKVLIPYDNKALASLTNMDFDTVTVGMELLKKIGLVKVLDNGEIYVENLEKLVGSKSVGAFKKQQQRLLADKGGDNCPPKIELDIELELEKDIELEKNNIEFDVFNYYENKIKNFSSLNEQEMISDYVKEFSPYIVKHAIDICFTSKKCTFNYLKGILRNYRNNKVNNLNDIKVLEQNFKQKQSQSSDKKYTDEWWKKLGGEKDD